jgi:carboxypeptidase Q
MNRSSTIAALAAALLAGVSPARAQDFAPGDSVLRRIWAEGNERSQLVPLAQALLDSIGPRLTGTPGIRAGNDWLVERYRAWGIAARNERYGSWQAWRRGPTHVDLVQPRLRSLEATMLAWSPGTAGPVTGPVVALPQTGFASWLPSVRGKYVLLSFPQPTCRPDASWQEFATPASFQKMQQERAAARTAWMRRVQTTGLSAPDLVARLEEAGAAGVLTSSWTGGWGVETVYGAVTRRVPMLDLSCEDYGLLGRLAENRQGPVLRVEAQAESLGEQPVFNTIAEMRGSELPNEYVMLSAHFDSWDPASGATDNGTGTVTMMEVMRILHEVYPRPKRTILVGHWSGEEQGLNGSKAFVADHPDVVAGVQALFNQDTGTGRTTNISMRGFGEAGPYFQRWMKRVPAELAGGINLIIPGVPRVSGSDYSSFICARAPAFDLSALDWNYGAYTWHTNRDTFDKIVFDDVRANAVLIAMLAYQAAEEPTRIPRPVGPLEWPVCQQPARSSGFTP